MGSSLTRINVNARSRSSFMHYELEGNECTWVYKTIKSVLFCCMWTVGVLPKCRINRLRVQIVQDSAFTLWVWVSRCQDDFFSFPKCILKCHDKDDNQTFIKSLSSSVLAFMKFIYFDGASSTKVTKSFVFIFLYCEGWTRCKIIIIFQDG